MSKCYCEDNDSNNSMQLEYLQLDKKMLKQLESQTYSNRTLARLIAISEIYAKSLGIDNHQMYKKFDQFDNLKRKSRDELEGELILQINCCTVSMNSYIQKYNRYDFPDDFNKKETLKELENIKRKVCNKDKKYYVTIINLINGNFKDIPSFDNELDGLENDDEEEKKGTKPPQLQLKVDIPIMKYINSVKKQVKKKYIQNPSYKVRLDLNNPMENNQYFDNLVKIKNEIDQKNNKKYQYKNYKNKNKQYNNNDYEDDYC